jgi:UDP-N-acetylmuramate: L-alanyl-gamma-D-glutamyl-meso-diaminopimelate ligase
MKPLDPQEVKNGFQKNNLEVITEKNELEKRLQRENLTNINFLFMTSGNYDGMDILTTLHINA